MKKSWKISIGAFVLLLLVFILPGLVTRKVSIKTVTHIRQPLTRVFVTFGDPARLREWMEGFEKIEHIYGLPFSEGSKYRLTFTVGDKKMSAVEEIIKVDWKKHLVIDVEMSRGHVYADMYFFQMDKFSEIAGTFTFTGNDPITRILLPWMKPFIQKKLEHGLDRFRVMMEKKKT
ncbi:MAG: SRPBCC family protein [Bacteroidales bacterium]|nr:SRPBCC family protein [Bacteroidales bacterium]